MTAQPSRRRGLPACGADLLLRIREVHAQALASGALQPIPTRCESLRAGGVDYVLRVVESLRRKPPPGAAQGNPFLPYEPALYVAHLPPRHVLLLNKFNVIEPHLLAVTEAYEPQSALLGVDDFAAALALLQRLDGLVFYNGGRIAGASQPHKHLQWVPSELLPGRPDLPVEAAVMRALADGSARAGLPFMHAVASLAPGAGAALLQQRYRALLKAAGVPTGDGVSENYNLLLTRRWMMVVPRRVESSEGISVNALGFAGALLVRDEAQAARVRAVGPEAILAAVSAAAQPAG
ncbi:phosphorylase [Fontimonas sp. SYSU GA230001]|uniref:ATP adenylyltransferase family protein n=1 Tax=Fontimonas sp. SYSU GA230001 TaxID=3142450 RepID=UPI0032B4487C